MQNAVRSAAAVAVVALGVSTASAATLVTFKPLPISPTTPEFLFDGNAFDNAAGTLSNFDGGLPPAAQAPTGLQIDTPFLIPGIAGGVLNASSTTFYDASLTLNGFIAPGAPSTVFGVIVQPLGEGTFSINATDGTLLLQGTVANSVIAGASGGTAGSAFSNGSVVTYTGGIIAQFLSQAGGSLSGNDFSFSLVDASAGFSVGQNARLSPFTANATGLFNATVLPEPATAALLALPAVALLSRRRA